MIEVFAAIAGASISVVACGLFGFSRRNEEAAAAVIRLTSAGAYGSIGFEQPDADNIIPFAGLTPELIIGWVQEKLGGDEKVTEIEAALQAQLDEQHAPTKAQGLPWN